MKCEQLHVELDEMSAQEIRQLDGAVKDHLDACPGCREHYELRIAATAAVRGAVGEVHASAELRQRVLAQLSDTREEPRRASFWSRLFTPHPAWAAAAFAVLLVAGYTHMRTLGYFSPTGQAPADMARFIHDVGHDAFLYTRGQQSLELDTTDPVTAGAWFDDRVEFPVQVPGSLASAHLEGVRLWHTVSRLSALVSYALPDGSHVTLFMVSAKNLADSGGDEVAGASRTYRAGKSYEYNVVSWQEGEVAYALVGHLSTEELTAMADTFDG